MKNKVEKIGILTFHRADNYGSVLQAYALKKHISLLYDGDCKIIDYQPPLQSELYAVYQTPNSIKNVIKNMRSFVFRKLLFDRKDQFDIFRKTYLDCQDAPIVDDNILDKVLEQFEIIVCGSDQIWNPNSIDYSINYFVPRIKSIKIAYGPSMKKAKLIDFAKPEEVSKALNDFLKLSVREEHAQKLVKELTGKSAEIVVDPTLLLDRSHYLPIESQRIVNKEYIFFYSINYDREIVEMVSVISKHLKLPVYVIYSTNKVYGTLLKGFHLVNVTAPGDFLALVRDAKFVLSNSFHGTAFSIIYRKNFFSLRAHKGNSVFCDVRINELLSRIGLLDRYLSIENYKSQNFGNAIEYDNEKIVQYVDQSKFYLRSAIMGRS